MVTLVCAIFWYTLTDFVITILWNYKSDNTKMNWQRIVIYMFFDSGFGFNYIFPTVFVVIMIGFVVVFGIIISRFVQDARERRQNNSSPVLTVEASVVAKRADVSYHHHSANMDNMQNMQNMNYSTTTYYVTFQVPSGDRMELHVLDNEYGLLVEGDAGNLTFQGTRYLGFQRS